MDETDTALDKVAHAMSEKTQLRYTIDTLHIDLTHKMWMYNNSRIITKAECELLSHERDLRVYSIESMHSGATTYCDKLFVYLERFGTHMPVPLRKTLLYQVYDL